MLIYKITNMVNGKIYIGKTKCKLSQRWYIHCNLAKRGSNLYLHRAIRKYGLKSFVLEVLDTIGTEYHLSLAERFWIKKYRCNLPKYGYNMTLGGDGGIATPETRRRISIARTGTHASEETKRKLSQIHKGKPTWIKGKHHSEETRRKISLGGRGPRRSKETRLRISLAKRGIPKSEETKRKLSLALKAYYKRRPE